MASANCVSREQRQNARENPLAAAAAAAAVSGGNQPSQVQNNVENLLDVDFDGAAPASAQKEPQSGMSGLEGLAGTPTGAQSPTTENPPSAPSNNLEDLMGVFGNDSTTATESSGAQGQGSGTTDLMNGVAGLDLSGTESSQAATGSSQTSQKKSNAELLDLF